jgi:uncharacterized membrane protein YesL
VHQVIEGLRAGWRGLQHLQHRGYQYIWANVLWVALSLPILTAPAAWAGLIRFSYYAHRQPNVSLDEFWQGFRENLKRSVLIGILNVVVVVVNVANLYAYQNVSGAGIAALRVVWLVALFGWFAIQLYVWPLLYAMEQPNLKGAYRNAAVMILLNPLFTLGIWFACAVVALLSVAFPVAWILLTGSALAAIANSAVQDRLRAAGYDKSGTIDPGQPNEPFFNTY